MRRRSATPHGQGTGRAGSLGGPTDDDPAAQPDPAAHPDPVAHPDPADDEALGPLEAELLAALWATGTWLSAPDLHDLVAASRPLAYTTVSTVLIRLWHKGHLERVRDGRAFAYRALRTREQYTAARMAGLLAELDDRPQALSWFVEFLAPGERAQLRQILKRDGHLQ